jgi:hypothetical protein
VIQAQVRQLLGIKSPAVPTGPVPPAVRGVVDVVNRSGQNNVAADLEGALAKKGYTKGVTSTKSVISSTAVEYDSSSSLAAAKAVAGLLGGVPVEQSSAAAGGRVRVVLGSDFSMPAALGGTPPEKVNQAAAGSEAPGSNANAPSPLDGGSIPCVK